MSAADDVLEMKSLANRLADKLVGAGSDVKVRVGAIARAIGDGVTDNRAYEFLIGKARRVDAWGMRNAERRIRQLEDAERQRRENEFLDWLQSSDPDLRGPMLDRLELVLRNARGGDRPMAVSEAAIADSDATYDQREYGKD